MKPHVASVALNRRHEFSKPSAIQITLVEGLGVAGDAHSGVTVQHRSRVARDPTQPNLRQVHLLHTELFDELAASGFIVRPGELGENITTKGIDLLGLAEDTLLMIGAQAIVRVTGLRNPCNQIDVFQKGLLAATLDRDDAGNLIRKAGVMAVVVRGGDVMPGDQIEIEVPVGPQRPLVCV